MNLEESLRVITVERFRKLIENQSKELKEIVELAAEICQTPIALITLLDDDTQFLQVKVGISADTTSREDSFCTHAIRKEGTMVVNDALLDPRFVNNPLVTGDPNIRFYAGSPLATAEGYKLGTLCVIDRQPRVLTPTQQKTLEVLSKQVIRLLEFESGINVLQRQLREIQEQKIRLEKSEIKLKSFFESSKSCYALVDREWKVMYFNKTYSEFVFKLFQKEVKEGELITDYLSDGFKPVFSKLVIEAFEGKVEKFERCFEYGDFGSIWWEIAFQPVYDSGEHLIAVAINAQNINERREYIDQIVAQNNSLKEIAFIQSHELRRPVSSIIGIMELIKEDDYAKSPEYLKLLDEAVNELDNKIRSIVQITNASADSPDSVNNRSR